MAEPTGPGAAEPGEPGSSTGLWRHVPLITVALLAVGTVLAFGYSQRLKREPLVVDRVEFRAEGAARDGSHRTVFSPNGDCRRDRMTIGFRTTKSDHADVEIIAPGGRSIRTLARHRFFKRYREHRLIWDGLKRNRQVPRSGPYRVRMTMHGLDRVLYLPGRIRLHDFIPATSACPDPEAADGSAGDRPQVEPLNEEEGA